MNSTTSGKIAEFMARAYLRIKGYRILRKNVKGFLKMPAGEVDFIAIKNKTLVFVEVKKRQTLEKAKYAISFTQKKRIINAAKLFIKQNPFYQNYNIRFDAILIQFPCKIIHIENAWQ